MALRDIERGKDFVIEVLDTTVAHALRVVGVVSTAVRGVANEVEDLVWDVKDVARTARDADSDA